MTMTALYWLFFTLLIAGAIAWQQRKNIDLSFYHYGMFLMGLYLLLNTYLMPDIRPGSIELEIFIKEAILFFIAMNFFIFWEPASKMKVEEAIAFAIGYLLVENIYFIATQQSPIWGGLTLIRMFSMVMISQAVRSNWKAHYIVLGFLTPLLPFLVMRLIFVVATRQYFFEIRIITTTIIALACLAYLKKLIHQNH